MSAIDCTSKYCEWYFFTKKADTAHGDKTVKKRAGGPLRSEQWPEGSLGELPPLLSYELVEDFTDNISIVEVRRILRRRLATILGRPLTALK